MTRYSNANFMDDDSVNSVQFTEGISTSATHIRYYAGTTIWKQRSKLEKTLLGLVLALMFVIMVLAIVIHTQEHKRIHNGAENHGTQNDKDIPCLKPSCVRIASDILSALDSSINPCDDFYQYSCNGWIKSNPTPEGKSAWGTFMKLEQQNQVVIKRVLEQPIGTLKSKAEQKAKLYYESCLDKNHTVESLGPKPLLDVLKDIGSWNINDNNFDIRKWSFQNIMQKIQNKYNIGALFSYSVGEDDKNSTKHILQVDQSGLSLPIKEGYFNKTEHSKLLPAYLEYMVKVGILLGGDENLTRIQMEDILEFETRLANITVPIELRRDEETLYNPMTIAELKDKANFIDWRGFFDDAMRLVKEKISLKTKVVVYAPDYLGNLTLLINEYQNSTKGKIILSNYLVWQVVKQFTDYLSKPFRDAYKGVKKVLAGNEGGDEQWRFCVQDTNAALGFAVGSIFVREVFSEDQDLKIQADEMIKNVRNAFIDNLQNMTWMDKESLKAAVIKANAISDMLGYPDFVKNVDELDKKYENLQIRNDSYFKNIININLDRLKKNLKKLYEPVNKTTWSLPPSAVNAYYTPTKNQMVIPAGILQSPFYSPLFPPAINYGGIGVVMGHELTHGFDDQGREFDKDGILNHWWKNETVIKFKAKAQCIIQQYNKYQLNGKRINGNLTVGENIADNGGLKAAYNAYLNLMKGKEEPQKLPGLSLTHKQLFFVAFAQVWCSTETKESAKLLLEKDTHSPSMYRVIGALSNLPAFSEEFNCKLGTRMNPNRKCEVW